jgi:hypothetical protein
VKPSGVLVVTPKRLVLGGGDTGSVTVSADGGEASWEASWEASTSAAGLTVGPRSGTASPDRRTKVEVRLDRKRSRDTGSAVITFRADGGGTVAVTVTWD